MCALRDEQDGRVLALLAILGVLSVKGVVGSRGFVRQGRGTKERFVRLEPLRTATHWVVDVPGGKRIYALNLHARPDVIEAHLDRETGRVIFFSDQKWSGNSALEVADMETGRMLLSRNPSALKDRVPFSQDPERLVALMDEMDRRSGGPNRPPSDALVTSVRSALTPELVDTTKCTPNGRPTSCHCYHASEALYHLIGGKKSGFVPVHGPNSGGGGAHWWLRHRETGARLDPTSDQFPGGYRGYDEGVAAGFLTREPSKRARTVIDRVRRFGVKSRGAGAMSKATRVDPVPDAKRLLLAAGRALYQDDPEHVEGGCGDVAHAIKAFADAVGLTGIEVEAGFATLRRKAEWVFDEDTGEEYKAVPESVWHAWLKVNGEIVDPTWHAIFGKAGAKYTVDMPVLDMLVCEAGDAEMIRWRVETIHRILTEDGWDLPSKDAVLERAPTNHGSRGVVRSGRPAGLPPAYRAGKAAAHALAIGDVYLGALPTANAAGYKDGPDFAMFIQGYLDAIEARGPFETGPGNRITGIGKGSRAEVRKGRGREASPAEAVARLHLRFVWNESAQAVTELWSGETLIALVDGKERNFNHFIGNLADAGLGLAIDLPVWRGGASRTVVHKIRLGSHRGNQPGVDDENVMIVWDNPSLGTNNAFVLRGNRPELFEAMQAIAKALGVPATWSHR